MTSTRSRLLTPALSLPLLLAACAGDDLGGSASEGDEEQYTTGFVEETSGTDTDATDTDTDTDATDTDEPAPDLCEDVVCDAGLVCDPLTGSCVEAGSCEPDRQVGDYLFCYETTDDSFALVIRYEGPGELDLDASELRLNVTEIYPGSGWNSSTQTLSIAADALDPNKYSFLLRGKTTQGEDIRPLFIPMWLGEGMRYSDFRWQDGIVYQVFTDRFLNADPSNDIDNSMGSLAEVDDFRSQWQGGDFAGITAKIEDGYFESMGINALWISSPVLNSHNSQPSVGMSDPRRFSSYHSYHPIATGYTHLEDYGYDTAIETAFGTEAELHALVEAAHRRGIRVIPDFVANHVQIEAEMYSQHPEWFFPHSWCDGNWDAGRINCWFTPDMPDFDYGANPAAVDAVVDHALWLIQEFNFDGFRADALKHMDDVAVRAIKTAVVEEIETTVNDHSLSLEPTIFYMVGESLGGWARYHVREDMVQGQVDEAYYEITRDALLTFSRSVRDLAVFATPNDTAYLVEQPTMGGAGGYPGAVMGNFFGNHDQWRALTEAGGVGNPDAYKRLRLAQTFLMTSPLNVPMLYQGDDIGTEGEQDPDNRRMQKFTELSPEEQASLDNVRIAGLTREAHPALRRGLRQVVVLEDWFWVYRLTYEALPGDSESDDEVYVAINRDADKQWSPPPGYTDVFGNCQGGVVPSLSSCIFTLD